MLVLAPMTKRAREDLDDEGIVEVKKVKSEKTAGVTTRRRTRGASAKAAAKTKAETLPSRASSTTTIGTSYSTSELLALPEGQRLDAYEAVFARVTDLAMTWHSEFRALSRVEREIGRRQGFQQGLASCTTLPDEEDKFQDEESAVLYSPPPFHMESTLIPQFHTDST